jgi:hypothetical protein
VSDGTRLEVSKRGGKGHTPLSSSTCFFACVTHFFYEFNKETKNEKKKSSASWVFPFVYLLRCNSVPSRRKKKDASQFSEKKFCFYNFARELHIAVLLSELRSVVAFRPWLVTTNSGMP